VTSRSATSSRPAARGRLAVVAALALIAACSSIPTGEVQQPEGREFIRMVPDSIDDVGFAPSVAIDAEGLPTITYFGFTAPLEEGEIPIARPVGSPFLQTADGEDAGAVLLASLSPSQIWNRGAVAQPRETPTGLTIPFGPADEPSLASLRPDGAVGTDLAIAGSDLHATWTVDTGVWYGLGPDFEVEPIEETPDAGAPSIAVDAAGAPIIAYTVAGEVRVAERVDDAWQVTSIADVPGCTGDGCPPPASISMVGDTPLVVVADPRSGDLITAHREGDAWTTEVVATGVSGGADLAAADGNAVISFATQSGVSVATGSFGSWSIDEVAQVSGVVSTAVAVDGQGATWVAWEDGDGVHLASAADEGFQEIEVSGTDGGVLPSLAVTEDGASVFLAWYDPDSGDLRLGAYAEVQDLLVAAQSPPPEVEVAPGPADCGQDGQLLLDITAQGTAFDTNCLVAPAAEPFTITFDNQDPAPVTHNVAIFPEPDSTEPIFAEEPFAGPQTVEYDVPALDAGEYPFLCQIHPTTMTGILVAVEGAGGGGGDGGGGGG
jgi:hypothetical protein